MIVQSLSLSDTLNLAGTSFSTTAGFTASSGSLEFDAGNIGGPVTLFNSNLTISSNSTGSASFIAVGGNTLSGDLATAQSIWVEGSDGSGHATLASAHSFTNHGTIRLESQTKAGPARSSSHPALSPTHQTEPSRPTMAPAAFAGSSATSPISVPSQPAHAQLTVGGADSDFTQTGGTISGSGSGSLLVDGGRIDLTGGSVAANFFGRNAHVNVAATAVSTSTIYFLGTANVLEQNLSPTTTLWGPRSPTATPTHMPPSPPPIAQLTLAYSPRIHKPRLDFRSRRRCRAHRHPHRRGSLRPRQRRRRGQSPGELHPPRLNRCHRLSTRHLRHTHHGRRLDRRLRRSLQLRNPNHQARRTPSTLFILGRDNSLTTDILPNITLWVLGVNGNTNSHATLTLPQSVTNHGTIQLESENQAWTSQVVVQSGTLTNASDGTIQANYGSGGFRGIVGNLTNLGTIATGAAQLTISGAALDFTQAGGTISGSGSLLVDGGRIDLTGGSATTFYGRNARVNVAATAVSTGTICSWDWVTSSNKTSPPPPHCGSSAPTATPTHMPPSPPPMALLSAGVTHLESTNQAWDLRSRRRCRAHHHLHRRHQLRPRKWRQGRSLGELILQGSIDATAYPLAISGTLIMDGGSTVGSVDLYSSEIQITKPASAPSTLYVLGGGNALTTDILPNITLWVLGINGNTNSHATLTIPHSVINHGARRLEYEDQAWTSQVVVHPAPSPTHQTEPSRPTMAPAASAGSSATSRISAPSQPAPPSSRSLAPALTSLKPAAPSPAQARYSSTADESTSPAAPPPPFMVETLA